MPLRLTGSQSTPAAQNRIVGSIDDSTRITQRGNVSPPGEKTVRQGEALAHAGTGKIWLILERSSPARNLVELPAAHNICLDKLSRKSHTDWYVTGHD